MNTIVLGANHNNTLGLVWSLGEAGHIVTLILYNSGSNYVSKSKYVSKLYIIKEGQDDVIGLLKKVSMSMDSKPAVFVSSDTDATLLNEHFSELKHFIFFEGGKEDGSVNKYRDKDIGNELAKQCGFTLPQNFVIDSVAQLDEISLPYPIVIKANNSVHGGKGAMKKCSSKHEVFDFINSLPQEYFPLQVQEFIEKEYEIMLLGCSLDGGNNVICPVANRKIRQYPRPMGLTSYSESIFVQQHQILRELAEKVSHYVRAIEYTGNFSAEFLYSKGSYFFLEVNLRNDGTSWLSTCSGYNLPDMVCRSFLGEKVLEDEKAFKRMHYMNIKADFNYVRSREISVIKWIKQFNKETCYSHYNKRDRKPFWNYLFGTIKAHF